MRLRRVCLMILGFAISTGICSVWLVLQQDAIPVVKGYAKAEPLPLFVEGTQLLAEEILTYEGEYIEDTEFGEYVFVTGLILRNTGDQGILRAKVKLTGENDVLEFDATYIPPGEAVLVLEKNRRETQDFCFLSCTGEVEYAEDTWGENHTLQIVYTRQNSIEITNIAEKTAEDVRLYYKTVYPGGLFYIGGITHCYRIHAISAGETVTVSPEFYAGERSKIVYIRTENPKPHTIKTAY